MKAQLLSVMLILIFLHFWFHYRVRKSSCAPCDSQYISLVYNKLLATRVVHQQLWTETKAGFILISRSYKEMAAAVWIAIANLRIKTDDYPGNDWEDVQSSLVVLKCTQRRLICESTTWDYGRMITGFWVEIATAFPVIDGRGSQSFAYCADAA